MKWEQWIIGAINARLLEKEKAKYKDAKTYNKRTKEGS